MEPNANAQVIVDRFEIPDELAKRLSELLTKQVIRERVLNQNLGDPAKYEQAEQLLMPIVSEIEAIKVRITKELVPEKYRSDVFLWNYDGYEIAKNWVDVITDYRTSQNMIAAEDKSN